MRNRREPARTGRVRGRRMLPSSDETPRGVAECQCSRSQTHDGPCDATGTVAASASPPAPAPAPAACDAAAAEPSARPALAPLHRGLAPGPALIAACVLRSVRVRASRSARTTPGVPAGLPGSAAVVVYATREPSALTAGSLAAPGSSGLTATPRP